MVCSIYRIFFQENTLGEFYVNTLGGHGFSVKCGPPCNFLSKTYCEYLDTLSERVAIDTLLAENGTDPWECTIIPVNPAHL
jgi:hypothetical protein